VCKDGIAQVVKIKFIEQTFEKYTGKAVDFIHNRQVMDAGWQKVNDSGVDCSSWKNDPNIVQEMADELHKTGITNRENRSLMVDHKLVSCLRN
jgi:hypothetical protein